MKLPKEIFGQHVAVLGKTRSGKSSVMRLLVEDLLRQEKPICVVDPKGDWWGLKSSADGRKAGFPVVIFGGEHADVPLNAHAGSHVAELVTTGNRPCIIDLGGWMPGDRTRFFIDFASGVFRATRGHRWLVIDEVHNFAPQGKVLDPDAGKMLHWTNRLFSEGLGKGLAIVAASQRPQKWHKDALTCCETLVAMRVIHKLDRDAMKDWIDGAGDAEKGRDVLNSIASMQRGEGWVWSPEISFGPKRIQFPMFETYDSFRPRQGESAAKLKGWADVDLTEVSAKLAATIQEAKANDPAALKARIRELEKLKTTQPGQVVRVVEDKATRKAYENHLRGITKMVSLAEASMQRVASSFAGLQGDLARLRAASDDQELTTAMAKIVQAVAPGAKSFTVNRGQAHTKPAESNGTPARGGKGRILAALAQHPEGLSARAIGILAGLSSGSGTFGTYLGQIRSEGLVDGGRDCLVLTDAGRAATAHVDPLPMGDDLRAYWSRELGEGGLRRMFDALCEAHPKSLTRDELGEAAGLSAASGTFGTYLGKLRTLSLVTGSGQLTAAPELFG